jgi:hypothetical protein
MALGQDDIQDKLEKIQMFGSTVEAKKCSQLFFCGCSKFKNPMEIDFHTGGKSWDS